MTTHPVYDQLLASLTDADETAVLKVLLERAGERVTRYELLETIQGAEARAYAEQHGLANNTDDRRNREAIERLQGKDYPIVSSSGQAGYILAADDAITEAYIAEIGSRITQMEAKKESLRRSKKWIPFIREWKAGRPAIQGRLL